MIRKLMASTRRLVEREVVLSCTSAGIENRNREVDVSCLFTPASVHFLGLETRCYALTMLSNADEIGMHFLQIYLWLYGM